MRAPATTMLLPVALLQLAAAPAVAGEGWSFRLTPQFWAPSLDAQLDVRGRRAAETEVAVFEELEAIPALAGEVRFGRFGLEAEGIWLDVGEDARLGGRVAGEIAVDGVIASGALSWRFVQRPRWWAEAYAGGRYLSLDAEVEVAGLPPAGTEQRWGDPFTGLAGAWRLSDRLNLAGRADIGGFGIGSDVAWEARGQLAYRLGAHTALALGYRHLAFEYEEGGASIDVALTGPFLALDLGF